MTLLWANFFEMPAVKGLFSTGNFIRPGSKWVSLWKTATTPSNTQIINNFYVPEYRYRILTWLVK